MGRIKLVLPVLLNLFAYGCNPVWAYSTSLEREESNFELMRDQCDGGFISVILSHEDVVLKDQSGHIRLPQNSDLMLLPCELRIALENCETRRGLFHWATTGSPISTLKGDAFQCVAD